MTQIPVTATASKAAVAAERISAPSPVGLLIRAVLLENLRRRDFYVVLIVMGLFLVGALTARLAGGVPNAATAALLLNLGLTLASLSAHVVSLLSAARQLPNELEHRTIYPLLAKPLGRGQLIIGKWAAVWISGGLTLLVLLPFALLPVGMVENTSFSLFCQVLGLQICSLGALSALAVLGSLLMPKALNVVVLALLYGAGGPAVNFIRARATGSGGEDVVRWVTGYLPDFSRLDLLLAYTAGGVPVSFADFALRLFHALAFTAFPLALAVHLLKRRSM